MYKKRLQHIVLLLILSLYGILFFWLLIPDQALFDAPLSTVMRDREGVLLGATVATDQQWRFPASQKIPEKFSTALVCFEDKRFYTHHGVDIFAIGRAIEQNITKKKRVSGASTLTMQVMRMAHGNKKRTLRQKLIETVGAIKLDHHKDKNEILSLYATHAPFGGNVVGLQAASWRYFGRDPQTLSWAEAAMLAVLPNAPSLIHPGKNRKLLKEKRDRLLTKLYTTGKIDSLTSILAKSEPLPEKPYPIPMKAPHLFFRLKNSNPTQSELTTTINNLLQKSVTRQCEIHQGALAGNNIYNVAAMVLDITTNEVIAYVGNMNDFRDSLHGYQVDMITAPRSSGSILKPFLYASMLDAGELLPTQLLPDIPTRIGSFAPQNYEKSYDGAVQADEALARSLNIPAIRMLRSYGVDRFHFQLNRLGMTTLHRPARDYGLSLILGGSEVTLGEITSMYAGLARTAKNEENPFRFPRLLLDNKEISGTEPIGSGASWLTLKALLEVYRPGVGNNWRRFASSRKISWKTGTSFGFRDAWAVGVTSKYAVGVWVGNADGQGRPGLTGLTAAAPLLFSIFQKLPQSSWFSKPDSTLTSIEICSASGFRRSQNCAKGQKIDVPINSLELSSSCPYCVLIHCDTTQRWRVTAECSPVSSMVATKWFVLPPAIETYYIRKGAGYKPLPPIKDECGTEELSPLSLTHPTNNASIFIPYELDGSPGKVVFTAAHRYPESRVFWYLDDTYIGETNAIHQKSLHPSAGSHTITITDEYGEIATNSFTILERSKN